MVNTNAQNNVVDNDNENVELGEYDDESRISWVSWH